MISNEEPKQYKLLHYINIEDDLGICEHPYLSSEDFKIAFSTPNSAIKDFF